MERPFAASPFQRPRAQGLHLQARPRRLRLPRRQPDRGPVQAAVPAADVQELRALVSATACGAGCAAVSSE
jgi:hypothetical protein